MEYHIRTAFVILLRVFLLPVGDCLRLEGHVETDFDSDFAYIGRFVFLPNTKGQMKYDIWTPAEDCCGKFVLFNGWASQWPRLQTEGDMLTCHEKMDLIPNNQNTKIALKEGINRCYRETDENGFEWIHCTTVGRRFANPKPRWYYLTMMNCHYLRNAGLNMTYKIHLTNGDPDRLNAEFSADESTNLAVTFFSMILLCCVLSCGCIFGVKLFVRKMLHVTYQMWFVSLLLHTIGLTIMTVGWYQFAMDGYERDDTVNTGHYFTSAGTIVYAILIILMSKGYTITRLRIRTIGVVKIFMFAFWFSVGYLILYYVQAKANPETVTNIYDTPATLGIIFLRLGATFWCLYGTFFTVKNHPDKITFYFTFAIFTTFWFLSEPVMIFLSNYALPLYCRAKWVHAVYLITIVYGHLVFILLTRPSHTNTYFPYHLSTNKVDIMYDCETSSQDKYKPTEATFANFLAITEIACEEDEVPKKEQPKKIYKTKAQPTAGFDIFLAFNTRAGQDGEPPIDKTQKPVPTVSRSVSMTTMLNTPNRPLPVSYLKQSVSVKKTIACPVDQPTYTPVTYLKPAADSMISVTVSDEGDDWQNLILQHLDEPEQEKKVSPTAPTKPDKTLLPPLKIMPVTNHVAEHSIEPAIASPAMNGQNGMYALADSDESSSEDETEDIPVKTGNASGFKPIRLLLPDTGNSSKKNQQTTQEKVVQSGPKTDKETATEPAEYETLPSPSKGHVIYVRPANNTVIKMKPASFDHDKRQSAAVKPIACQDRSAIQRDTDHVLAQRSADKLVIQNTAVKPIPSQDEAEMLSGSDNTRDSVARQNIAVVKPVVRDNGAALILGDIGDDEPQCIMDKLVTKDGPPKIERGRSKERRSQRMRKQRRIDAEMEPSYNRRLKQHAEPTIDSVLDPTIDTVLDSMKLSQRQQKRHKQPRAVYAEQNEMENNTPVMPLKTQKHRRHSTTSMEGQTDRDEDKAREERRRRRQLRKMRAAQVEMEAVDQHLVASDGQSVVNGNARKSHRGSIHRAKTDHNITRTVDVELG